MWLPLNRKPNKLKVDREPFMKKVVTYLDGSNESVSFFDNQIENFTFDTFFVLGLRNVTFSSTLSSAIPHISSSH